MNSTEIAAALAQAGFRVTTREPTVPKRTEPPRVMDPIAKARAEAEAAERHKNKIRDHIERWAKDRAKQAQEERLEPTDMRREKGLFACVELDGTWVERDLHATMVDRLRDAGLLTNEQAQGGHDFAALMQRMQLVPAGRSCLDNSPRGFDDQTEPTHAELRDERDRKELYLACGPLTWSEMRRVCVEQHAPRSLDRLRIGLDICAKFWC